ncbi:MAG: hypothetical protein CMJ78_07425 [Planctomycetaceae bacterium]|nr:hypothetical protein [Planctomycetaceae bacterium]
MRICLTLAILLTCQFAALADGVNSKSLEEAKAALDQLVEESKIAGGMHLVVRNGKRVHFHVAGVSDLDDKTPLKEDTILRIYSMSKPITSVAAMTLWEQDKFQLDDPVSKYIPAFKNTKVLVKEDGEEKLIAPKREITVRDVFRHTTGYSYGRGSTTAKYYKKEGMLYDPVYGMFPPKMTIAEGAEALARIPANHHPGERFTYGFNTDLLGRLIEVWSGQTLEQYMKQAVFDPLKMNDTAFALGDDKKSRFSSCHVFKDGKQIVCDKAAESPFVGGFKFHSGGGGLVSTIGDYAKFCQMVVDGGKAGDRRVLKEATLKEMFTNQLKGLFQFGLGFAIRNLKVGGGETPRQVKGYFWGGYASTAFHIVPEEKMFQITMRQSIKSPNVLAQKVFSIIYTGLE